MTRAKITRRLEFDAGHRLEGHEGKCRHVHGHRYVAEVTVSAPTLDAVGRVVDFGVVKNLVGGWIDIHWDHGFLLCNGDPIERWLRDNDQKHYVLHNPPSAEHMARHLYEKADEVLRLDHSALVVERVRLYETPNCWADYPG